MNVKWRIIAVHSISTSMTFTGQVHHTPDNVNDPLSSSTLCICTITYTMKHHLCKYYCAKNTWHICKLCQRQHICIVHQKHKNVQRTIVCNYVHKMHVCGMTWYYVHAKSADLVHTKKVNAYIGIKSTGTNDES